MAGLSDVDPNCRALGGGARLDAIAVAGYRGRCVGVVMVQSGSEPGVQAGRLGLICCVSVSVCGVDVVDLVVARGRDEEERVVGAECAGHGRGDRRASGQA